MKSFQKFMEAVDNVSISTSQDPLSRLNRTMGKALLPVNELQK